MKTPLNSITNVVEALLRSEAVKAVKYLAPNQVVRAVRCKRIGVGIEKRGNINISLTIGRPNYVEREYVALLQKAKEPFPVKKIQIKFYNSKKKKLTRKK